MDNFDPEKTIDAVWCVDSETGRRVLMDRNTNKEIAEEVVNENGTKYWKYHKE